MGNVPTALRGAIRERDEAGLRAVLEGAGDRESAAHLINTDHSPECITQSCTRAPGNALYYAVKYRHNEAIVAALLEYDCDLHATGEYEETCLHAAARYAYLSTCNLLVQKGADIYATDDNGRYPIHSAGQSMYDSSEVIKYLMSQGKKADVDLKDFNDRTPLHEASFYGNEKTVKTLLDNGANVNATSKAGYTPLHLTRKDSSVWAVLVAGGADVQARSKKGELPGETV